MAIKYKWLAGKLEEYIYRNMDKGITKLPTEAQICDRYEVSRQTVRQALMLLEEKGLIEKRQGSGSFFTGRAEQNNTIAVLLQGDQEYTYPRIRQTIENVFEKAGFFCHFFSTGGSFLMERTILSELAQSNYRGILIEESASSYPCVNASAFQALRLSQKKILFFRNRSEALSADSYITYDASQENRLLLSELLHRGHRSIGLILKADDAGEMNRFREFLPLAEEAHCNLREEGILFYTTEQLHKLQSGETVTVFKEKLQGLFASCSSCICSNDEIAHYVAREYLALNPTLEDFEIALYEQAYLYEDTYDCLCLLPHGPSLEEYAAQALIRALQGYPLSSEELPVKLNRTEAIR